MVGLGTFREVQARLCDLTREEARRRVRIGDLVRIELYRSDVGQMNKFSLAITCDDDFGFIKRSDDVSHHASWHDNSVAGPVFVDDDDFAPITIARIGLFQNSLDRRRPLVIFRRLQSRGAQSGHEMDFRRTLISQRNGS